MIYNKDALSLSQELKNESIDLIYMDVLFGTGNNFQHYNDNKFNSSNDIRSFYYPILEQCQRILKSTGLIYFHCDYNISHYCKILLDDVFSKDNFRNEIIWYYNSAPRKKRDFGKRHDTIFRYSKSNDYFFNTESTHIRQPYSKSAPRGYAKEKYYDNRGKILDDVWNIPMLGQNDKTERVGYSTQKPLSLLYPIIDSSCPHNGTVLDLFCGSGTTLCAAKILGRKYIGCDISKVACDVTNKRLEALSE